MITRIGITTALLFLTCLTGQNFIYEPDDWEIIHPPGAVNAVTADYYNVYFGTDEGIYTWNITDQELFYDYGLSRDLAGLKIYHLYYDTHTSNFWCSHEDGLSFKSDMASHWRRAVFDPPHWEVDDIGSTSDYICIRNGGEYRFVNPFSGYLEDPEYPPDDSDIEWGNSRFGRAGVDVTLFGYQLDPAYQSVKRLNDEFFYAVPTVALEDFDGNTFIGTASGTIYISRFRSRLVEPLQVGLGLPEITEVYEDETGSWWFGDSEYKRKGFSQYSRDLFLSRWLPDQGRWINYYSDESSVIRNTNINCMVRDGYFLFCGTMEGILALNVDGRDWESVTRGLKDDAVWDLAVIGDVLLAATARGISEIALESLLVLPPTKQYERFNRIEVYDFEKDARYLYVAAANGLHRMELDTGFWQRLDDRFYREVHVTDSGIFASDGMIWKIIPGEDPEMVHAGDVFNFHPNRNYLWINERNSAVLIDRNSAGEWTFTKEDGIPGSLIYQLGSDGEFVWFATNNGIAYFNWSRYFKLEK